MSKLISDGASDDLGLECDNGAVNVVIERMESNLFADDNCASDCESSNRAQFQPKIGICKIDRENDEPPIEESNNQRLKAGCDGLIRLNEGEKFYEDVKVKFMTAMEGFGVATKVEHIDRYLVNESPISQAKLQSFLIYAKAIEKTGGHANIKQAWFGASKDQIKKIILHGFSYDNIEKDGDFGYGLYLSTDNSVMESVESATVDDDGTRHIMLCRVLLGNVEAVQLGSKQSHPSSEEFQTGVDNLNYAKKLIIWSTNINTHIIPEYVISFKTLPGYNGAGIKGVQCHCPRAPWIPSKAIVSGLSKILPPETMQKINEYHTKYTEGKISKRDMLVVFRDLAGDMNLLMVVKDYKEQVKL